MVLTTNNKGLHCSHHHLNLIIGADKRDKNFFLTETATSSPSSSRSQLPQYSLLNSYLFFISLNKYLCEGSKCKREYVLNHMYLYCLNLVLLSYSGVFHTGKDNPEALGQTLGCPLNLSVSFGGSNRCRVTNNCCARTHTHACTHTPTHTLTIKTKLLGIDAWPMLRHSQKICQKNILAIQS